MQKQRQKKSQLETRRKKHEGNELRLWQSKKEKESTEENHDQEKNYEEKIKMAALTKRQQATLKKHSVHHTAKHMTEMRKLMRAGKTFTQAHKSATRKVGK